MAQLIKIQDYISRYETDIYQYSSRYNRLKRQKWDGVKALWESNKMGNVYQPISEQISQSIKELEEEDWLKEDKGSLLDPLKKLFKRKNQPEGEFGNEFYTKTNQVEQQEFQSLDDAKKSFLNELFRFQMNWASSTIRDYSFVDKSFYSDSLLLYFLQHFPDNFLVMYKPIFQVKNAPLEMEVILISPTEVWCISVIEAKKTTVYTAEKGRYWPERDESNLKGKVISPLLGLNRMEKVISSILNYHDISFPVKNIVLCKDGFIEPAYKPAGIDYIDFRTYQQWYKKLRNHSSPIKHSQLKVAGTLLSHCQSTYVKRSTWQLERSVDELEMDED